MKKIKNKIGLVLIFLFMGAMFFPSQTCALEPKIKDLLITNDAENVLLYARLLNGFKPQMELAILAGIPTTFTMWIEVYQERSPMWDKKIIRKEIKRSIKYDNLKKPSASSVKRRIRTFFRIWKVRKKRCLTTTVSLPFPCRL